MAKEQFLMAGKDARGSTDVGRQAVFVYLTCMKLPVPPLTCEASHSYLPQWLLQIRIFGYIDSA
jgi:hypothetical protein